MLSTAQAAQLQWFIKANLSRSLQIYHSLMLQPS